MWAAEVHGQALESWPLMIVDMKQVIYESDGLPSEAIGPAYTLSHIDTFGRNASARGSKSLVTSFW